MITSFRPLFTVSIDHAYYGGPCPDFDFVIPTETTQRLRGGRIITRVRSGTLFALYEADNDGVPGVSIAGQTLRFGLRLLNPRFSNFTALPFDAHLVTPLYRNSALPGTLDAPVSTRLVGRRIEIALTGVLRPVILALMDGNGLEIQRETVSTSDTREKVSWDLSGGPRGRYTVEATDSSGTRTDVYYVDPEMQSGGIFGILEVSIDAGFYTAPPMLTIQFATREETLNYYVVLKNYPDLDFGQLSVIDTGATGDARMPIVFTQIVDFTADELPASSLAGNDGRVVLFRSQERVPRTSRTRHNIQLNRNDAILVQHLPQPGAEKVNADVIVHISKPES